MVFGAPTYLEEDNKDYDTDDDDDDDTMTG
jgi:hypothetical protein